MRGSVFFVLLDAAGKHAEAEGAEDDTADEGVLAGGEV